MSVINQVLNQLEQRGEHAPPEQTLVRAVPQDRRSLVLPLLALLLALAGGVATWRWMQMRQPAAEAVQSGPLAAAPPANPLALPDVVAPQAEAEIAASAVAAEEAPPPEMPMPASRLSFELSSIPLPSALRQDSVAPEVKAFDVKNAAAPDSAEQRPAAAPPPPPARPQTKQAAPADAHAPPSSGAAPMKQVSPAQRADAAFRKAVALMQQGHISDAIAGYEAVLRQDAGHDAARQALVALLLESKRGAEAGRVLREGLENRPEHTGFAMLLGRLQVEQGALEQAIATLEKSLPYADARADYQAFFAALLQRRNRHKEAITHYQIALQLAPGNAVWLMGYGISLQAVQRTDDARDMFRRALESGTLNPELQAFVQSKIKEL